MEDRPDPRGLTRVELDALRQGLNPGIRVLVMRLRALGFDTVDSGDGRTHVAECDRPYPYVSIRVDPSLLASESDRLRFELEDRGVHVDAAGSLFDPDGGARAGVVEIEASYDPITKIAIIDLRGLDDDRFVAVF